MSLLLLVTSKRNVYYSLRKLSRYFILGKVFRGTVKPLYSEQSRDPNIFFHYTEVNSFKGKIAPLIQHIGGSYISHRFSDPASLRPAT